MTARPPNQITVSPTRGVSLIEMVAVLGIGTLLLGVAGIGFDQLMRLDRRFSVSGDAWSMQARLIETLREDAHRAVRCRGEMAEDNATLKTLSFFDPGGAETKYTLTTDGRCERVVLVDLAGVNLTDAQTAYRLPAGATWTVDQESATAGQLIRLTVTLPGKANDGPQSQPSVVALGRETLIARGASQ